METAGWERAHGYASNEHLLEKFKSQVTVRENEWDNRYFHRVSNAEHLQMSEDVGMINLSYFAIIDVVGSDAEALVEYVSVAKVGSESSIGKGVYTHFSDQNGGVRADVTIIRLKEDHHPVMDGGDPGAGGLVWLQRMKDDRGLSNVTIEDKTIDYGCLGLWGPNARTTFLLKWLKIQTS